MVAVKTDDLMNALRSASHIDDYLKDQEEYLLDSSLPQLLKKLCSEKGLSKSDIIRGAELNEIYGYQIFAGKRRPSRDKLICIGLSIGLTEKEMQALLKAAGMAPLYPKNTRDSIILFGFLNGRSVPAVNESLFTHQQPTL